MITYVSLKGTPAVRVSTRIILDPDLSAVAKCAVAVLLALPHDHHPSAQTLSRVLGVSRNAAACALRQLVQAGYLARFSHHEGGRFRGVDYVIYDSPEDNPNYTAK